MKDFMKRYGITLLGAGFMFLAFIYFLKLAIDMNWVPPVGRAALGLLLGITGLFIGYTQFNKNNKTAAEIIAGLGTSILYATFAYASFSTDINWSGNTLMVCMITVSSLVIAAGYKMEMRILVFLSLLGGFLTPVIIKANLEQDMLLFFYVLTLNIVALWLSATKSWQELRIMSYALTMAIFISYYFYFDPEHWVKPMFYITTLFAVYMSGLILASWHERNRFDGLNLYLGLVNAILFVFWSVFILSEFAIPYTVPSIFVGVIFIAAGFLIHRLSQSSVLAPISYAVLGILVIAIAANDTGIIFETAGMQHVITTCVWLFLATVVYIAGRFLKQQIVQYASAGIWGLVMIYWYSLAWNVEWVEWFGVNFIPFINPGALVWIAMASLGFIYSNLISQEANPERSKLNDNLSTAVAIASNIVVGGLLTIQIENTWLAYEIDFISIGLARSFSWFIYALIIFLWGSYSRQSVFRLLGSLVLLVSSAKVLLFDLSGEATMYKVGFLFSIGAITMLIGAINRKWKEEPIPEQTES